MAEDPKDDKRNGARNREVSIFADPAAWSEQAEELYLKSRPQEPEEVTAEDDEAIGDIKEPGMSESVFSFNISLGSFSDMSNSLKNASDPYGSDGYGVAEDPIVGEKLNKNIHHNQYHKEDPSQSEFYHHTILQPNLHHQHHNHILHTPTRTKESQEEYMKQNKVIHTMTPRTELSTSENSTAESAPVDQRCCGLFRRAFEEEKVFRRLVHTAVAMLMIFSILSIFVIVRSSETKRAKAANKNSNFAPTPAQPQQPTIVGPLLPSSPAPTKRQPTAAPTRLTDKVLKDTILRVFPAAVTAIEDPSSAQSRALVWMSSDDSLDAFFVTEKLIQRWALAVLYYSTGGEEWRTHDKWLTNHDECEWYSADPYTPVCDDNGMLYSLHLRNNGLKGTLPDELTLLSNSLEFLYLNDGLLEGTIPPTYGRFTNLKRFYLQVNKLSGPIPPEISGMETLENLAIGRNQLTGSLPEALAQMDELRLIDLSSNKIEGPIPKEIGSISNLSSFLVNGNHLSGLIPSEFGRLSALTALMVQQNRLEGPMPWQVCEILKTKQTFWVSVDCDRVSCSEECNCKCI